MASSSSSEAPPQQQYRINSAYHSFKHNASLAVLVLAPVLIALPPRKLDLYTFSLTGALVVSVNQLTVERTGRGLLSQFAYNNATAIRGSQEQHGHGQASEGRLLEENRSRVPDEILRRNAGTDGTVGGSGKTKELWMRGDSEEDWKTQRLKEEQEKLDQGEGYGSMIVNQIWEVWNQGEKKAEELKEKNEEVIEKTTEKEKIGKRG